MTDEDLKSRIEMILRDRMDRREWHLYTNRDLSIIFGVDEDQIERAVSTIDKRLSYTFLIENLDAEEKCEKYDSEAHGLLCGFSFAALIVSFLITSFCYAGGNVIVWFIGACFLGLFAFFGFASVIYDTVNDFIYPHSFLAISVFWIEWIITSEIGVPSRISIPILCSIFAFALISPFYFFRDRNALRKKYNTPCCPMKENELEEITFLRRKHHLTHESTWID